MKGAASGPTERERVCSNFPVARTERDSRKTGPRKSSLHTAPCNIFRLFLFYAINSTRCFAQREVDDFAESSRDGACFGGSGLPSARRFIASHNDREIYYARHNPINEGNEPYGFRPIFTVAITVARAGRSSCFCSTFSRRQSTFALYFSTIRTSASGERERRGSSESSFVR